MTEHTRPERSAEFAIARRHLAKVYRDPCGHCTHRETILGHSICPTFGRTFPRCLNTPGLQFDPDHETLRGNDDGKILLGDMHR
jgi:hypothetical protein